jgi:IS4 transposase
MLKETDSAVLFRVKSNLLTKRIKKLADGSWLVDVEVRDPKTREFLGTLRLREIQASITYQGGKEPLAMRLWTTLLDATAHPAAELVELYAERWEEELFFRELKSHLHRRSKLLDAQTPETAAQEALAMLLAASLVAMQREEVARRAGVEVLRISFAKIYQKSSALCELIAVGGDLIPAEALVPLVKFIKIANP